MHFYLKCTNNAGVFVDLFRFPDALFVMQSGEAPLNSGRLQRLEGLVDLTLTYRQDSDIVRTLVLQKLLPETLIHLTGYRIGFFNNEFFDRIIFPFLFSINLRFINMLLETTGGPFDVSR